MQRIRDGIDDPARAYLTVFNSTPLERKLAVLLGIPLNGVDPKLSHLGTKSGSRKVFREAGVELPQGFEDLRTEHEVENALLELRDSAARASGGRSSSSTTASRARATPSCASRRASGGPTSARPCSEVEFSVPTETAPIYFDKFSRMGGVVEEFIEARREALALGAAAHQPAAARSIIISTHDQILGGPSGQVYIGCSFPADEAYRLLVQKTGVRVGEVLASHGVVSRFGVDFLVYREDERRGVEDHAPWRSTCAWAAPPIPSWPCSSSPAASMDPATGLFHSPTGHAKYYRATDNLQSERYAGLLPEDLIEILTYNKLHYSHASESGVLFHLIGALSEFGKLGMTAIANSRQEVDDLYQRSLRVLERETAYGHHAPGGPAESHSLHEG